MMRYPPDNEEERAKEIKANAVEPWMMNQLNRNWNYVNWGPHEDYQAVRDLSSPDSPRKFPTWGAFRKGFAPGEHPRDTGDRSGGEIIGWYFNLARECNECVTCDGSGQNPETKRIEDDWYDFNGTGRKWCNNITQDETDALVEKGRLREMTHVRSRKHLDHLTADGKITQDEADSLWEGRNTKFDLHDEDSGELTGVFIQWRDSVPAEEVNGANERPGLGGHDAINRWICVETRAKRLGVYGNCPKCDGEGFIAIDLKGRLQLVLWIVNPATGQNYGLEVDNIEKDELGSVYDFLQGMRDRLVSRLDMPEATTSKVLRGFGGGESMMWTQNASQLSGDDEGWGSESIFPTWEDLCWPTHHKYGDRDNNHRVPKDHPKFAELWTGEPSWGLNDLNELIGVRFGFNPHDQKVESVYMWIAHPRKGCSRRLTVNSITEEDLPDIRRYMQKGVERARQRLDPVVSE